MAACGFLLGLGFLDTCSRPQLEVTTEPYLALLELASQHAAQQKAPKCFRSSPTPHPHPRCCAGLGTRDLTPSPMAQAPAVLSRCRRTKTSWLGWERLSPSSSSGSLRLFLAGLSVESWKGCFKQQGEKHPLDTCYFLSSVARLSGYVNGAFIRFNDFLHGRQRSCTQCICCLFDHWHVGGMTPVHCQLLG